MTPLYILAFFLVVGCHGFVLSTNRNCMVSEYNELIRLRDNDECFSVVKAFQLVKKVYDNTHSSQQVACRIEIINYMRYHFGENNTAWEKCQCTGTIPRHNWPYNFGHGDSDHHSYCYQHDQEFRVLYDQFYHHHNEGPATHCYTHHSLWYNLSRVNHLNGVHCQREIVSHIGYSFQHDPCTCSESNSNLEPVVTDKHCTGYESFRVLESLLDQYVCMSFNKVWHHLSALHREDNNCRLKIQTRLAGRYADVTRVSSDQCSCTGHINYHNPDISYLNRDGCQRQFSSYTELYDKLYTHPSPCGDHTFVWRHLNRIGKLSGGHDCQLDFIERGLYVYPEDGKDPCNCVSDTTPAPSTTTSTTTTTTTTAPTTTTPGYAQNVYACDKFSVVADIAQGIVVSHETASCDSSRNETSEALLMVHCNTTSPVSWHRGSQVMKGCQTNSSIPAYTPISTFQSTSFDINNDKPGVFLSCEANGFKMVEQPCSSAPVIRHIPVGGSDDPFKYYRIV